LCPDLEWLRWDVDEAYNALPFFRIFLPLKCISLHTGYNLYELPWGRLAVLIQITSFLPTSLEDAFFTCDRFGGPPTDAMSSFVRRCGSSLRRFAPRCHYRMQSFTTSCSSRIYALGPPPLGPFQRPFFHLSRNSASATIRHYCGSTFSRRTKRGCFGTFLHLRHHTRTSEKRSNTSTAPGAPSSIPPFCLPSYVTGTQSHCACTSLVLKSAIASST